MKHHYENIYVGEYNFFAIQALEQAFANPSKYLSLYLIGDWGYGRTTLLKAFKELVIAQNKTAVFYSVSKFMEDLLESIRNEKSSEFKKYLYEVDVLILDNIELLKDKSGTQSAWVEILDKREEQGKLTVVSSFLTPQNMSHMERPILNRLDLAMAIHIMKPNEDEWPRIIDWFLKDLNFSCSLDIIDYLYSRSYRDIGNVKFTLIKLKFLEEILHEKLTC